MHTRDRTLASLALLLLAPAALTAQSLASRVAGVRDGVAELRFAARPGLCGDGRLYYSIGRNSSVGMIEGDWNDRAPCLPGPVRVRLRMDDGMVRELHTYVGPSVALGSERVTDLGVVPALEAARYFLSLASTAAGRVSTAAVAPAVLADSASVWRDLVRLARDMGRPRGTRNDAGFWLGRYAAAKLEGRGEDIVLTDATEEPDGTREAAVFALSQLRDHEGIPALIDVARTNRNARVRAKALFWLGQSGDPRGVDVMEEILSR